MKLTILGLLLVGGPDEQSRLPIEAPAPRCEQPSELPQPINPRQGRGLEGRIGALAGGGD